MLHQCSQGQGHELKFEAGVSYGQRWAEPTQTCVFARSKVTSFFWLGTNSIHSSVSGRPLRRRFSTRFLSKDSDVSKVQPRGQSRLKFRLHTSHSLHCTAQHCHIESINHAFYLFTSWWQHHSVTLPGCVTHAVTGCDPYQLISAMVTVDKKREVDVEGFQERYFLTKTETVVLP